jgi:hypothetical protein
MKIFPLFPKDHSKTKIFAGTKAYLSVNNIGRYFFGGKTE